MAKKKINELDASSITLDRIIAHANPSTGKADRGPVSELIALLTAQTPVKTYADETALLANTDLAIGYIAYNADTGAFYLYNGPTRTDINNYTQISGTDHFKGIYVSSASLISSVPSADPGDYAFVDEGVDYPVELWIWDEDDTEWIQSGATGGTVLSVTGTTNRITSTGGATPVIDIDAAYDAIVAAKAPIASPTFTGTPAAPTPSAGDNDTSIATTAFVTTAIAPYVITEVSASTAGATITLNFQVSSIDRQNVIFIGSASFTGSKTFALSNTTVAKNFFFVFEVTSFAGVAVTVPADWSLSTPDFTTGTTWTPTANGRYRMSGVFVNSLWEVFVDGPASV